MNVDFQSLTQDDISRVAAAISPADFARLASRGRWKLARHLDYINRKLLDTLAGRLTHLMVFCPPRHGKSELISRYLPCVFLGRNPDQRVILTSYEAGYASEWGRKARDTFEEYGERVWGLKVDPRSSAADHWDLLGRRGGMDTAGCGGPITGKGGNLVIMDDICKNDEEARSRTYRDKTWDWYCSTLETRVEPSGSRVLIMTRWHEDDIAGRLLRDRAGIWTVIVLPAYAEADDPLGRQSGEPLWPERWPLTELEAKRKDVSLRAWSAEYQQKPTPDEGVVFKRSHFRYYTNSGGTFKLRTNPDEYETIKAVECDKCWRFSTVDLAASLKTTADFTVVSTWGVTPANELLLLDRQRRRLEGPDQVPLLWRVYQEHKPGYFAIEKVGYQLALIQSAIRSGLPVREVSVDKDKISRAIPAAARIETGQVFFPEGVAWLPEWEQELCAFPSTEHDDQVDTLSAAVAEVTRRGSVKFY